MKSLEARMTPSGRDGKIIYYYTDFLLKIRRGEDRKWGIKDFLEDEPYHTSITGL
ncbi:MAG: hypothetical protein ACP5NU_04290 [Methanomicrobiales archaeon]|jgi:hypothetical protein|nr:hypothetical protein [Methanoregulaceae archaeon]HPA08710.1 hypothetical protein [Methanoregulaceae archaeon]HPS22239.1 hypothetical protein [Methanoregulaceae archaeon]HQN89452.1 hypothetical protein [Methanoregulaceae archaeon]HQP82429.1 hypothetical protein [Methanoregulaceae archaeon]